MSWESSVCDESSPPNTPWATRCTHPATSWRDSARTWFAFRWALQRPSIRSPRRMGSVNGKFSLPYPADLPGWRWPETHQPAPLPGWEVKAFCKCAVAWGPRPPVMERIIRFRPLRSTPSPSVKMGRKSRKGQKDGRVILGTHSPLPSGKASSCSADAETQPVNQGPSGNGLGRRADSGAEVGLRDERGCPTTIQFTMMRNSISLRLMLSGSFSEPAFYACPFQRQTPWETEFHTQSKRW